MISTILVCQTKGPEYRVAEVQRAEYLTWGCEPGDFNKGYALACFADSPVFTIEEEAMEYADSMFLHPSSFAVCGIISLKLLDTSFPEGVKQEGFKAMHDFFDPQPGVSVINLKMSA